MAGEAIGVKRNPSAPFILPKIDVDNFTGRLDQLAVLEAQLLGNRQDKTCSIVGLSGGGGMGKSALAFHFATLYRDKFPDGVIGLPVDGKATHEVARDFARRCGKEVDEDDDRSASTIMQEVFAHRRMLLIFDNADQSALKELRPGGDRCALIVTTRDRQIPDSFGITNDGIIDLPPMPQEDARDLLRRILGTDRVDAELEAADQIIEMTGGLPLALQIAGSGLRGRQLSLASYVESLRDEKTRVQRLQIRGDADLNVTASLNLSLDLLEESEKNLFTCLSVCAKDGFSLRTAMVAGGLDDEWEARDLLDRLYQLSLLNEVSADRYVFHALIRVYAQEHSQDRNQWEEAARRHAEYFINLVRSNNVKKPEIADHIAEDLDDILQTARWLRDNSDSDELRELAYQFVRKLQQFFYKYGYSKKAADLMTGFQLWAEYLKDWDASSRFKLQQAKYLILEENFLEAEVILKNAQDSIMKITDLNQQQKIQSRQFNILGGVLQKQQKFKDAIYIFERQIKIDETLNDQQSLSIGLNRLGGIFQQQGRLEDAIVTFERQIKIAESLNDQKQLSIGLNCLGGIFQQQGRLEDAIATFERQIKIAESLNDQQSLSIGLNCLGGIFQQQGRLEDAIVIFERVVKIEETLGESRGLARTLSSLSTALKLKGDRQSAISVLHRIVVLEDKLGNSVGVAMTLRSLGSLLLQQQQFVESINVLRQAVKIDQDLGNIEQKTKSLNFLAETLYTYASIVMKSSDTREKAISVLDESYRIYQDIGDLFQEAIVLHTLGRALKSMKHLDDAEEVLRKSQDIFYDLKENKQLVMVYNTRGGVLERKKDWKAAELILREGYDLAFKEQDALSQSIISNSLGKLFAKQKGNENFSLAHMYFINSIKLGKIAKDEEHLLKVYIAWGKALIHTGKSEESLIELRQAMEIAERLSDFHSLRSILSSLTNALTRLGRHSEVIEYYDRAIVATQNHPALIDQRDAFIRSMSSSKKPVIRKKPNA